MKPYNSLPNSPVFPGNILTFLAVIDSFTFLFDGFILSFLSFFFNTCSIAVRQHVSSSPVYFRHVASVSATPTTCSTKVPNERTMKTSSGLISTRHRADPNKELSRILRADAAVKGIERKANSEKYNTLWPKAVLEALDEAIRENRWQSALKVMSFFFVSFLCHLHQISTRFNLNSFSRFSTL